jgi:hypothetical protein
MVQASLGVPRTDRVLGSAPIPGHVPDSHVSVRVGAGYRVSRTWRIPAEKGVAVKHFAYCSRMCRIHWAIEFGQRIPYPVTIVIAEGERVYYSWDRSIEVHRNPGYRYIKVHCGPGAPFPLYIKGR